MLRCKYKMGFMGRVSNRFKLLHLPSYLMLFLSDQVQQFIFQGSFDKGCLYEQLMSCIALFISNKKCILPNALST